MFTGNFKGFFFFTSIIVIHELGHIIAAIYYKWKIEKIILLPFGALTLFKEKINRPLKEEFIILIAGPIAQVLFTFLCFKNKEIIEYSMLILLFNLLPIYPLDGSKLLNIMLNKVTSFKKSHIFTIYISFITILFIIVKIKFNLIFLLIISFIIVKVYEEYKNHNNIFNKFLLERYISNFHFKKEKQINGLNVNKMKRDYRHIFYNNNRYHTEREIIKKRFDLNRKL